jgi:hypothetical protein
VGVTDRGKEAEAQRYQECKVDSRSNFLSPAAAEYGNE